MLKSLPLIKPNRVTRLFTTESGGGPWLPKKRVSRPTMEKIRALAAAQPDVYNVVELSKEFKLSVEGIRRILRSSYEPQNKVDAERQEKNRYEAMGERRKEFKTKHPEEYKKTSAWTREQKENDISSSSKTRGNNWSNDMYLKRNQQDWKKVSRSAQWDQDGSRDGERRSFSRDSGDRSFNRERTSFNNREGEHRSFSRDGDRFDKSDRRSFDRSEERRPFHRSENGSERKSFHRSEERRPFNNRAENGDEHSPSFYKSDKFGGGGDRSRSFSRNRNSNDESDRSIRSFNNNRQETRRFPSRDDRPRRSYRDDGTHSKDE